MMTAPLQKSNTSTPNEYPRYDTEPSYGVASVSGALWYIEYPFIAITPRSTLTQW